MMITPKRWIWEPNTLIGGLLEAETGSFPVPIETHNVSEEEVTLGQEQNFSLNLESAGEIEVYADEAEYYEKGKNCMAAESCIPCGLFPAGEDPDWEPSSLVMMSGTVYETFDDPTVFGLEPDDVIGNMYCMGQDYGVIIHKGWTTVEKLQVGNIVSGMFWLQGWPQEPH